MDETTVVKELIAIGGQAAVFWVALYYLLKILKQEYDARIGSLEHRSDKCEEDRVKLRDQMSSLQSDRINLLEKLLDKQAGSRSAED